MSHPATKAKPKLARRDLAGRLQQWKSRVVPAARKNHPPRPKRNFTATLREWHKKAGLFACLFLIWLALSGVLLTRSVELGFDATRIDWDWLMAMYGLHAEPPQNGYTADGHWLASTAEFTVVDGKALQTRLPTVTGFVAGGDPSYPMLFVGGTESLVLLSKEGERIDELRAPILPISSVRRMGNLKSDPSVIAIQDFDAYQSADGGETWKPVQSSEVLWSQQVPMPEEERARVVEFARPRVIVEQFLIDLHSGRLFGPVGAWLITLIGFVATWIAISGVWMWWRTNKARKQRQPLAR